MNGDISAAAQRLRRWAIEQALPLWRSAGFDAEHGRFEERLTLAGGKSEAPTRLIVQSRQIYSYALAARRGWNDGGLALVEQAFASMVRDYRGRDGRPGWAFSIHRDGRVADGRRDFYSHSFVLLAVGSYVRATGKREALAVADEVLAYLDGHLAAPRGGYFDGEPLLDDLRRQNPHMHLFEGLLTLWTASGDRRYLERAGRVFDLFAERFFQPGPGVLCEYFDQSLAPAPGVTGQIVEPGHHCEWVWLLRWFERESGRPVGRQAEALYDHAHRLGFDAAGLPVDEALIDGTHRTPSRRLWPVTEAIKANVAEATVGRPGAAERVARLTELLFARFLEPGPAGAWKQGGWMDRLDAAGSHATDVMPASSLYHLLCAIDEVDRFADQKAR